MAKENKSPYANDPRIESILSLLVHYATGDFSQRGFISEKGDEIDAIMLGLNSLAEETQSSKKITQHYLNRIEKVMEVLLNYTLLDFSETLPISDQHDEIDAISLGLNTLAEELRLARETEKEQLETIRENKEQIEVILANAPNAVVIMDENGFIIRWNSRAEKTFGWTEHEVLSQSYLKLLSPPGEGNRHAALLELVEQNQNAENQFEFEGRRRDGTFFPMEIAISSVTNKGRKLYITFIDDISHRKAAEKNLRTANQHLEESNKELEAFTYSVSHDLRAPLRAISGYSQILLEKGRGQFDASIVTYLESIVRNTKKMGNLIDDLLALSRYSRAELKTTLVNMNKLVESVIQQLEKNGEKPEVKFTIKEMPPAMVDQNLFFQVYANLISNAVKYSSHRETPEVEIGAETKNGKTTYFVKDNGSGFDMQFYNKLFGVFQRLHDSSQFEGTGVGLAIVKRIITKHHGKIWAESELDKGSAFYFTLD